jgi:F-type H+-transporting ATPase subunit b
MFKTAEFWVAVSFFIFVGLLIWKGVPGMITSALDARADKIKAQLDEAQKLREEAQILLAEYERKRKDAEKEAQSIVDQAEKEAESFAVEARVKLKDSMARRTKMAEDKIAQAEAQAVKEVRAAAADLAITAATTMVADSAKGAKGNKLIDESIALIKTRLN